MISKKQKGNSDQKHAQQQHKISAANQMPNTNNGVVINVYVENTLRPLPADKKFKITNPNPVSKRAKRSHGNYDRRSLLLSYSQELRRADHNYNDEIRWNEKWCSRHKSKASFFLRFHFPLLLH